MTILDALEKFDLKITVWSIEPEEDNKARQGDAPLCQIS